MVGLNLLAALPEIGGGWAYLSRLLRALGTHATDCEFIAFVTKESEPLVPPTCDWRIVRCGINPRVRAARILYENSVLQVQARRLGVDCMHWFANTQGLWNAAPALVTVFDLQAFGALSEFSLAKRMYLRAMMRRTAAAADRLLPMSDGTASELQERLHVGADRMTVVNPVLDERFRPADVREVIALRRQHDLPCDFWIYVAHYYPHKNHVRLLYAYAKLVETIGDRAWPLVLRGSGVQANEELSRVIASNGLAGRVRFLPEIAESELPALYSAASAEVFPSLYEGLGMPVVEALACGCPVIAGPLPPIQRAAGDAVAYFDNRSVEAIAEAMRAMQEGQVERLRLRAEGLQRVEAFRPEWVVPRLVDAYWRCAEGD